MGSRVLFSALGQAWPPFVLVVGLLLIGAVVEADGLFVAVGTRIERIGGGPVTLLATLLGLVAVVIAMAESGYGGRVPDADRDPRRQATRL